MINRENTRGAHFFQVYTASQWKRRKIRYIIVALCVIDRSLVQADPASPLMSAVIGSSDPASGWAVGQQTEGWMGVWDINSFYWNDWTCLCWKVWVQSRCLGMKEEEASVSFSEETCVLTGNCWAVRHKAGHSSDMSWHCELWVRRLRLKHHCCWSSKEICSEDCL